jgi:hypothetical protein
MQFINFDDPLNRWNLDKVEEIVTLVKEYTETHNLENVELYSVEDNTWCDVTNKRYDIWIRYHQDNQLCEQKLLILKGQILDGKEFHRRHHEFYK